MVRFYRKTRTRTAPTLAPLAFDTAAQCTGPVAPTKLLCELPPLPEFVLTPTLFGEPHIFSGRPTHSSGIRTIFPRRMRYHPSPSRKRFPGRIFFPLNRVMTSCRRRWDFLSLT